MENTVTHDSLKKKQGKLFLSWSGDKGKKVADLITRWIEDMYENINDDVFFSPRIEPGRKGYVEIIKNLRECKKCFVILTRERLNSPWIHFEAGAISMANKNNCVIPIYVDIDRKTLGDGPLSEFQSDITFLYENLADIIHRVGIDLGWTISQKYREKKNEVEATLRRRVEQLKKEIDPEPVIYKLHQSCNGNENCYVDSMSGCLGHLDENTFFSIRNTIVENATGELIICGPSLSEAIGHGSTNNRSLRGFLRKGIAGKKITSIKFMLTDLSMFEAEYSESNEAISRVMGSLNVLKKDLFHICNDHKCHICVYFLPLHNIDHIVLTEKYMLSRSTKLWTSEGEYKGEFALYQNAGPKSEYGVQLAYLRKIMELSTKINLDIDTVENDLDSYISKEVKTWRRKVKDNCGYAPYSTQPGELEYIHLYKLYYSQLTHYVACDWNGPNRSELRFTPNEVIDSIDALFDSDNLLGDSTQKYLLRYIKKTEDLLRGVVEKYSTASVKGEKLSEAHIFPSLDLGFPNNSVRLAGGFATGMLITWKCGTPIVPVDATVNVCSSSVFELPDTYDMNQSNEEFTLGIEKLIQKATKAGYAFNFDSGNHFLMIAKDEDGKNYLVLHSSAKEFKDSYIGLYPTEGNWYSDKIRTYPTPYIRGKRYIRYLKGEDATFFISMAKKLEKMNVQIHKFFADGLCAKKCGLLERSTYHHYYMPTDSSIAIGTFVEEPGTTVPVFSAPGKAICLYKVDKEQNWTIQLGGKPKCLIPHGWGQAISGRISTSVDYMDSRFTITVGKETYEHDLFSEKQIKCSQKKIRQFTSCEDFFDAQNFIKGRIVKTLTPKYLFCREIKGRVEP